jgi:hypothetical protein
MQSNGLATSLEYEANMKDGRRTVLPLTKPLTNSPRLDEHRPLHIATYHLKTRLSNTIARFWLYNNSLLQHNIGLHGFERFCVTCVCNV